ncbi:MAG: GDSL family lipase [Lachnospiraceae bacterium]|nr:GDSL family lipase [Lachnospiraceae bacterium]
MRILCIGDSNTWGYNPTNGQRYKRRWTKVLVGLMPENEIVEEGLNGRTLLSADPVIKERCGITGLKMLLMSHKPVDYVVVMLGTNEMKKFFECSADYVAKGIREFIEVIQNPEIWQRFQVPKLLIISPVLIREELLENGDVFGEFDENSVLQSKCLARAIEKVCREYKVEFMNAADYAEASLVDYIHMDEENHRKLAEAVNFKLREMFEGV